VNTHYLKYFLFIFFFSCWGFISCQTKKPLLNTNEVEEEQYLIKGQYKILDYDKLGNLYLVSEDNEILQLKDNKVLFRYSNRRLGDIYKIDVSNPQKILVYYGDYYQIVFLDNTLSAINQLDLEAMGFWDVNGVALSRDNQIWIYDPVNIRLLKINENGKVQLSSNELYSYGISGNFFPDILVGEEVVYLYDEKSIHLFDEFGTWKKQLDLDTEKLSIANGYLLYRTKSHLRSYSMAVQLKEPSQIIQKIKETTVDFSITSEGIYLIDHLGLYLVKG